MTYGYASYGYASSGWTNEPPYRPPPPCQPARRWHKCKARMRLRKAGWVSAGGVVYVGGPFTRPRTKHEHIKRIGECI